MKTKTISIEVQIPDWVNWIAIDNTGQLLGSEDELILDDDIWISDAPDSDEWVLAILGYQSNWRESKQKV